MNYQALLTGLVLPAHPTFDVDAAARSGSCSVRFKTALDVTFEAEGQGEQQTLLHMHCVIGKPPAADEKRMHFFAHLLQLHLFGFATGQSYFGFDALQDNVLLFRVLSLQSLVLSDALHEVESFVNQAQQWRDFLPDIAQVALATEEVSDIEKARLSDVARI